MFRPSMGSYTPVPQNYDRKSNSKRSDEIEPYDAKVSLMDQNGRSNSSEEELDDVVTVV